MKYIVIDANSITGAYPVPFDTFEEAQDYCVEGHDLDAVLHIYSHTCSMTREIHWDYSEPQTEKTEIKTGYWSAEEADKLIYFYEMGEKIPQIAKMLNRRHNSVYSKLHSKGIKARLRKVI